MSATSWFAGFLIVSWVLGYGSGAVFLYLRKFIEKVK